MRFQLNNIGKIQNADIKLNGLSIIAGENGSGKSTVGKMLFSVIKGFNLSSENSSRDFISEIKSQLYDIRHYLISEWKNDDSEIKELLPIAEITSNLIEKKLTLVQLKEIINILISHTEEISLRTKANIEDRLKDIEQELNDYNNPKAIQRKAFELLIRSEFRNSVCSTGTESSSLKLTLNEQENTFISVILDSNIVKEVLADVEEGACYEDATYIESPLYLHLIDTINNSRNFLYRLTPVVDGESLPTLPDSDFLPMHISDFTSKIQKAKSIINGNKDNILKNIFNTISGSFEYDEEKNQLFYKNNGQSYLPINTASGAKAFGVLQLLLQSEAINQNRILIWDEPENHLHPEWQVIFADVILQLVLAGIPIVISTHSPYFIQAIRFYAAKYGIEKYVNYYFAECADNQLSNITDVTTDLNRVFTRLATPLNNIMNVDMVRKHE